jgi:hypothetical protein
MFIHDTPMAVCGATKAHEALRMGLAFLLEYLEPDQLLRALWHLAKLKNLPIDEGEFLSLIEQAEYTPDEFVGER